MSCVLVVSGYCGGCSGGGDSVKLIAFCFLGGGLSSSESSSIESGCCWVLGW